MNNTEAQWEINLMANCPHCDQTVNLIDWECFWDYGIKVCDHGTDDTKGVEVTCPNCCEEFKVDLIY